MGQWIEVARTGEVPPGRGRTVTVRGRCIALFNDGGEFLAIDDTCPHEGASLGEGLLHEGRVICPLHSWVFDLRSGRCPRGSHAGVATYATRCTGDRVEVRLASNRPGAEASG